MATISNLLLPFSQNVGKLLTNHVKTVYASVRFKAKKASGSTRHPNRHPRPKHRGWRVQDGAFVRYGTILATQLKARFHPGLYVGFGKDGTLVALEDGRVMITCEKIKPDFKEWWVRKNYTDRMDQVIYKKHFNVIPEPHHFNFKLIDRV